MMLGTYYIGYEGIRKSTLTWQGLRWGLAQGYISHADILRYASDRLKEDSSDLEYELYQCKPEHLPARWDSGRTRAARRVSRTNHSRPRQHRPPPRALAVPAAQTCV